MPLTKIGTKQGGTAFGAKFRRFIRLSRPWASLTQKICSAIKLWYLLGKSLPQEIIFGLRAFSGGAKSPFAACGGRIFF
jgi:hypothetical protein